MEMRYLALWFIAIVILALVGYAYYFVRTHYLGTFKFDNAGSTYRCRLEFETLDYVEKCRFVIVKVEEADLSLPGESKSQH